MSDQQTDTTTTEPPANGDAGDELGRLRAENAAWRRKLRDTEQGHAAALDAAKVEGRAELTPKLLDAYVVAGAAGRFANVADALQLVNREGFVGDDGGIDTDKIATALDSLLSERPHLAGKRFVGSADQGARPAPQTGSGDWGRDLINRDAKR